MGHSRTEGQILGGVRPTSRCGGRGYRELFKVRFSFAVVPAVAELVVSAATPLSSRRWAVMMSFEGLDVGD
jgi:hypothetical protein